MELIYMGATVMDIVNKTYYRTFQAVFNVGARALNWRKPIPVTGVGSASKIPDILKNAK